MQNLCVLVYAPVSCLHCFPPRGPVSTTSFGGGGGGGVSYKTTRMGDRHFNPLTFTPEQWRPEPKGRQIFWNHRRGGLWPITAIMHKMFTFAIEQSEFLRLCVCGGWVRACVGHHFVCVSEVPRLLSSCTVHVVRWCDNL